MLKAILTPQQDAIIQDICDIQIQSLIRMSMEDKVQTYLNKVGISASKVEIQENVSELIRQFDQLKSRPNKILSLDTIAMGLVKHILINYDEEYSIDKLVKHKSGLWKKINIKEMFNLQLS